MAAGNPSLLAAYDAMNEAVCRTRAILYLVQDLNEAVFVACSGDDGLGRVVRNEAEARLLAISDLAGNVVEGLSAEAAGK